MVTSTSTPGSMLMDVICLTISEGLCRSMSRLWMRIWNRSQVLDPSPQGVFLVVILSVCREGRKPGVYGSVLMAATLKGSPLGSLLPTQQVPDAFSSQRAPSPRPPPTCRGNSGCQPRSPSQTPAPHSHPGQQPSDSLRFTHLGGHPHGPLHLEVLLLGASDQVRTH